MICPVCKYEVELETKYGKTYCRYCGTEINSGEPVIVYASIPLVGEAEEVEVNDGIEVLDIKPKKRSKRA